MSTAAPVIAPLTTKRPFWSLPRRDFVFGGLAGMVAGKATDFVQPLEWAKLGLPHGTNFSFAQFGEDLVASSLLNALGVVKPSYLDIGAWEPIKSNNTYLFYRRGGRGVLVEPNPARTPALHQKRSGDIVIEGGIGLDDTPFLDYYMLEEEQLNTFDKEQVEKLAKDGVALKGVVKMPMFPINRVMVEHFGGVAPDFMSIDVEGLDLAILKTLDFDRFRPKVICAETIITFTLKHNTAVPEFLATKGYVVRGGTYPNMLFVDGRLPGV
jgi:hypothetical protein